MSRVIIIANANRASRALGITLELAGHEPVQAQMGTVGLLVAQAIKPDVLLLDAALTGVPDAAQLCRQLRARSPHVRVVLMGGSAAQAARAVQHGASGWLPLPFEPWEALAVVERHLAKRALI